VPQPPTTTYIAHENIKALPYAAQQPFREATLAAGGTLVAEFDVAEKITDPNSFLTGAFPGGAQPQVAVGPYLDALYFADQAGQIDVAYAVDLGCAYRTLFTAVVAANVPGNISGLRITGRFVRLTYTNGAVIALVELGVYVRSS
jgi:hypothetical protein